MAYRSRVGICVPEEIAVAMQENIGELPKRLKREVLALLKEADVKIEDEGCQAWCWDRYTWNSSSPDVAFPQWRIILVIFILKIICSYVLVGI